MIASFYIIQIDPGLRITTQIQCHNADDRRKRLETLRERYPLSTFLNLDVYQDCTVGAVVAPTEAW